ncbi:MAG: hypothetical protein K0U52_06490, partial [Gammaproteobacteria bacterium]|nr:hypothetical protein [Gammaproteobacteria bacterium]
MASGQFLSKREHLGLILNTDGVSKFKSSSLTIWPVYLAVTNFPPHVRMNIDHLILACIWAGPQKPKMDVLLKPVLSSIACLNNDGVEVYVGGRQVLLKAKLLSAVFDLPARSAVLNMKQYNGEYGCTCCLSKGKAIGGSRIYLPQEMAPMRSHAQTVSLAEDVIAGSSLQGVKGPCIINEHLNIPHSFPLDYMHCVLERVTKLLLSSWFNSKNHQKAYYLGRYVNQITKIILKVKLPHDFRRSTRSIDSIKQWKASEFRVYLLYLAVPVMKEFLPAKYVYHLSLLVLSIHILLGRHISQSEVDVAEKMLNMFYELMPSFYSESHCTPNVHYLRHLCHYVRLWGPLWAYSMFGYENMNGHIKKEFHGSRKVLNQLVFNVQMHQSLPLMLSSLSQSETPQTIELLQKLSHQQNHPNMVSAGHNLYFCGRMKKLNVSSYLMNAIQRCMGQVLHSNSINIATRMIISHVMYHSEKHYTRKVRVTDSCTCCYVSDNGALHFARISFFCYTTSALAVVRDFIETGNDVLSDLDEIDNENLVELCSSFSNRVFRQVERLKFDPELSRVNVIHVQNIISK